MHSLLLQSGPLRPLSRPVAEGGRVLGFLPCLHFCLPPVLNCIFKKLSFIAYFLGHATWCSEIYGHTCINTVRRILLWNDLTYPTDLKSLLKTVFALSERPHLFYPFWWWKHHPCWQAFEITGPCYPIHSSYFVEVRIMLGKGMNRGLESFRNKPLDFQRHT